METGLSVHAFSVFLPVYNEEAILVPNTERLLDFLAALQVPFEVIIGSNGSTDNTCKLGRELEARYPQVRFFELPEKGPGTAFGKAVELARYDQLISLDMDLSVALGFISTSLELLETFDIVIGSKKLGIENRSLYRRWGSNLFIAASKWLTKLPFDDFSLGAKAYRKSVLKRYPRAIGRGTFYVEHIIFLAHRDNLRITQIPVQCTDNRQSRFNLAHEGLYRFSCLVGLWLAPRKRA